MDNSPTLPAAPDDNIGKTIAGRYRIEGLLGEGGMGKVYRANQVALDKPIVLKVLRQALLSDERTVARFQREAKAASRLNHPNSIAVIDFGQTDDGALYMAMEYVHGKDLHHILSREWPLPEARIIRIVSQVLSALSDAHKASVIHRDLKPENIMVEQRRGDPDFVKVLDFGIAKIMDGSSDDGPALTRAGFVCGTPEYMSPEQARGAQLDPRSDLYAVGVILYQLTSGVLPFESDNAVGFATKHLTETPIPPSRKRSDARITPALERLIMRAMSKSPDERPQTAEAFRSELIAIDKERRASAPLRRGGPFTAARNMTPEEFQRTNVGTEPDPGWGLDRTVRAEESSLSNTNPLSLDNSMVAEESTVVPAPSKQIEPEPVPNDRTDPEAEKTARPWILPVVIAVGVVAVSATAFFLIRSSRVGTVEPNTEANTVENSPRAKEPEGPLYDFTVNAAARDEARSKKLESEGNNAWHLNRMDEAREKYFEAWKLNPTPALSLKIGEIFYQREESAEAKAWWTRHLKDSAESRAVIYINTVLPRSDGP